MLQAVVIQNSVIDPFTCGTLVVYFPVLLGITRDTGLETQIASVFYINRAPISSRRTFFFIWAGIHAFTFKRTAVFMRILYGVVPPMGTFRGLPCKVDGRLY